MPNDQIDLIIRTCDAQRCAAMLGGHLDIFSHLFHPQLTYIHSNGTIDDLGAYLEKCRSRMIIYHKLDHQIINVVRKGNLAIAFGELDAYVTSGCLKKEMRNKTVTIWEKADTQWQLLVYQATPLK